MPPAARDRLAPSRAGAELPSSTESGFSRPFFTFCPGIRCQRGRGSRLFREVRCTWRVPFCTFRVPAMHLGPLFRWSWPCPAAARRWSVRLTNRSHLHAARAWGRLCFARGRRFPPMPGGTALAALARGGHAGCRCRVLARERCPAIAPWRGRRLDRHREDVATYRGRVRRPRAGLFPASPLTRPAADCPLPARRAVGRVPGSGTGDGQRNWQTV